MAGASQLKIEEFLVPDHILLNSPSRSDGVDEETENELRIFGCELIQEAGILLKLPQVCMVTGQVLFHRFYCKKSFKKYDVKMTAISSLFLAAKVEEIPKRLRDVITVYYHLEQKRAGVQTRPIELGSDAYWEIKNEVIKIERHILKDLGFRVFVEHPHKFIMNYLFILKSSKTVEDIERDVQLLGHQAWNFANDCMRSTVCLRFKPEVIATACIFLAARMLQLKLPTEPRPWWELFDATLEQIEEICYIVLALYRRAKARYIPIAPTPPGTALLASPPPERPPSTAASAPAQPQRSVRDTQRTTSEAAVAPANGRRGRSPMRHDRSRSRSRGASHSSSSGSRSPSPSSRRHKRGSHRHQERRRHHSRSYSSSQSRSRSPSHSRSPKRSRGRRR